MRVPLSTYRIQFNPDFRFEDAGRIRDYLKELGISDLYASPIFKVRRGSMHGYDVVDPNEINGELGGYEKLVELSELLKKSGIGWLQDIVPNHMAYDSDNAMLMDVLENGEHSPYYAFFDIEWNHIYEDMRGRLLAPFLGKFYGESLNDGEIHLCYDSSGLFINYYDLKLPLRIESYHRIFTHNIEELTGRLGEQNEEIIRLVGTLHTFTSLPHANESGSDRAHQIRFAKEMLWELYSGCEDIRNYIEGILADFNGKSGEAASFDRLDNLLSGEMFRLSFWKVAAEEINYRRFFNINQLISLRVEDESVFESTHALLFRIVEEGIVSGLRIDHIDGLYNPHSYLAKLRKKTGGIYTVAEKILGAKETLPSDWPVEGTTGYDFLNCAIAVLCDRGNEKKIRRIYARHAKAGVDSAELIADKKRMIIGRHMAGDIDNLAHLLKTISGLDRYGRDITLYGLRRALVEVMAFFPVYRTYVHSESVSDDDKLEIQEAVSWARRKNPGLTYELNFIEKCLLLEFSSMLNEEEKNKLLHFVARFQQFTGPLMAKGYEDTFLYVFTRLLALNDVGGNARGFGISVNDLHNFNQSKLNSWKHSMNATATHDTKRGEDARARLCVLSEIPDEWEAHLRAWKKLSLRLKKKKDEERIPDDNDEYFFYQTLLGAWPNDADEHDLFVERIRNYIIKAVREAKVHTAWIKPDEEYESAYLAFVDALLKPLADNRFLNSFLPFQKKIAFYGMFNSLSQTLLKIASPGVPDFYQGAELWDLNLVDPDNRRPVDYEKRKAYLNDIRSRGEDDIGRLIAELLSSWQDGRIKMFLIHRALGARRENAQLFQEGDYLPLPIEGELSERAIAFARRHKGKWAVAVVPRLLTSVIKEPSMPYDASVWGDARVVLPEGAPASWTNAVTGKTQSAEGRSLVLAKLFASFPAALLVGKE